MATTKIFRTTFQICKPNTGNFSGKSHQYRRAEQTALVSAPNNQGVLAILTSNLTLAGSEVVEILASKEISEGSDYQVLT